MRGDGLESIGITSNGIGLKPKLKDLKLSGVDRINISLDTLHEQKYSFITRRKGGISDNNLNEQTVRTEAIFAKKKHQKAIDQEVCSGS